MNYWLHRITGGDNAIPLSEELFKKGYISIGWSDFSDEADLNTIRQLESYSEKSVQPLAFRQ